MKFIFAIVAVALIAAMAWAQNSPSSEYLPPFGGSGRGGQGGGRGGQGGGQGGQGGQGPSGFGPQRDYLPPTQSGGPAPAHSFGADGYRYKSPTRF